MFVYVNLFVAMLVISLVAMSETSIENECTRRFGSATTISSDPGHCCTKYFECKCMHALCVKADNNDSVQCAQFNEDCYDLTFAPEGGCLSVTWDNFADKCTTMNKELDLMFHSKIGESNRVDKSANAGSTMTTVVVIVIVAIVLISLAGCSIWLYRGRGGHGKKGSGHTSSKHKHHKITIHVDQGKSNKTVASTAKQSCKQQLDGQVGGKDRRHMLAESHRHSASKVTHKHTNHQIAPKVSNQAQETSQDKGSFDSRAVNTRILPCNLPSHTQLKNMLR